VLDLGFIGARPRCAIGISVGGDLEVGALQNTVVISWKDVEVIGVSRMMEYVLEHGGVLPTHTHLCHMPKKKMRPVVLEVSIYLMELVVLRN
jgi:hypothetical protein